MKACLGGCADMPKNFQCPPQCPSYVEVEDMRGLKDHQIQLLVNAIRDEVQHLTPVQSLRNIIAKAVVKYLEENNLRIDAR